MHVTKRLCRKNCRRYQFNKTRTSSPSCGWRRQPRHAYSLLLPMLLSVSSPRGWIIYTCSQRRIFMAVDPPRAPPVTSRLCLSRFYPGWWLLSLRLSISTLTSHMLPFPFGPAPLGGADLPQFLRLWSCVSSLSGSSPRYSVDFRSRSKTDRTDGEALEHVLLATRSQTQRRYGLHAPHRCAHSIFAVLALEDIDSRVRHGASRSRPVETFDPIRRYSVVISRHGPYLSVS